MENRGYKCGKKHTFGAKLIRSDVQAMGAVTGLDSETQSENLKGMKRRLL
jgi:hypothetical protein